MAVSDFSEQNLLMAKQASRVAAELKKLRVEAGLTVDKLASELDMVKSTYAYYEDDFKGDQLPIKIVTPLLQVLPRYGIPKKKIWALSGLAANLIENDIVHRKSGEDVDKPPVGAPTHNRARNKSSKLPSSYVHEAPGQLWNIDELDVRAGAGSGGTDTNRPIIVDGELLNAVSTIAEWRIPADLLRPVTNSPAESLKIITIVGDSMVPDFLPGQRALVDTADRAPSPPGVFAVWDGLAVVVKQVEYIAHSDPAQVLITSRNRDYQPYKRALDEAYIQGRVIGAWKWT